jgi:protein-tyrosine phosphatase
MSKITNNMYLGNYDKLFDTNWFHNNNIKVIIDLIRYPGNYNPNPFSRSSNSIQYFHFPLSDHPKENAFQYYPQIRKILQNAEAQHKNVYVHCFAGISRSATMVLAYLMDRHNLSLPKAYNYVKNRRQIIQPNEGFIHQLRNWEKFLQINRNKHKM